MDNLKAYPAKPTGKVVKARMELPNDILNSWPVDAPYPDEMIVELRRLREANGSSPMTVVDLEDGRRVQVVLPHDSDDLVVNEVEKPEPAEEEAPQ